MPPHTLDWARDGSDWPNREASRFVRAAGLRWHVQRAGDGPTILLIHGTAASTHSWRDLFPILAQSFDVIAPDLPGHGFTAQPRRAALTLPAMAAGLGELLAALGAEAQILVGHSAGAAVAAEMALAGRARPRAIVSFNGAFTPFRGVAGQVFPPMAKILSANPLVPRAFAWGMDKAAVNGLLQNAGGEIDREGARLYQKLLASPGHVSSALGMLAAWELRPLVRRLPELACRLELVFGEEDRAVPPSVAMEVADRAPHAHLVGLAGLGHLAHEEKPEVAAEIIRRVDAETRKTDD